MKIGHQSKHAACAGASGQLQYCAQPLHHAVLYAPAQVMTHCTLCSLLQNETIVLIHFSPRYKRSEILHQLDIMLPPALRAKCVPLLNGIE